MKMKPVSFLLLLLAWRLSSTNAQNYNVISTEASDIALTVPVEYSCVFRNLWTSARHPVAYPNDAHWSPMVLVAHSQAYTMWEEGQLASPGVEIVAEEGATSAILTEINAAGSATNPAVIGSLFFTQDSERELQLLDFEVDESHPFVSAITMIAPSPDWFSGFSDFDARDVLANAWYQEFEVETFPWDAGTADDLFFPEEAPLPIFMYSIDRLPSNGAFASSLGNTLLPVARWTCTLQTLPTVSTVPSLSPSQEPSMIPSIDPSVFPSMLPSLLPSVQPSVLPSVFSSALPSVFSSELPSISPSVLASDLPSESPSEQPSEQPSVMPSILPSAEPSVVSPVPSRTPTVVPTVAPSASAAPVVFSATLPDEPSGGFGTISLPISLLVLGSASFLFNLW